MTARHSPVRLGLVGAGPWGRKIADAVAALPDAVLAGVAGRADWQALIADPGVAGIIVATPPATHAAIARAALAARKAVFIEKPLALAVADAEAILAAARKAGVAAMVDHVHLFHPAYAALKRQLTAEAPVHMVRTRGGRWGPFRADVPVLWDWGPHDVAYALDLLGFEPERVTAAIKERKKAPADMGGSQGKNAGKIIALSLTYADGGRAELEFGNLYDAPVRELIVQCRDCDLVLDERAAIPLVRLPRRETESCLPEENAAEGAAETIAAGTDLPLTVALAAFAALIGEGRAETASLALGVAVTKVLARAERALTTGKPA